MEGKSWGKKKRCFYIPQNDNIYCHNCGWSSKPYKWIREVSNASYDEIWSEVKSESYDFVETVNLEESTEIVNIPSLPEDSINLFDPMQVKFYKNNKKVQYAVKYIKDRKLDVALNKPDAFYISLKDYTHKNRLIIPFKDDTGQIIFYQSRKLFESDDYGNYLSKVGGDKSLSGMDKISEKISDVFLFEGPLDSFFVKNGLGLGGINRGEYAYTPTQQAQIDSLSFFGKIWVLDSQWIDETAREKTETLIGMGEKVFIWPENLGKKFKDFNEMCLSLNITGVSPKFIQKNSCRGISATVKMKLIQT